MQLRPGRTSATFAAHPLLNPLPAVSLLRSRRLRLRLAGLILWIGLSALVSTLIGITQYRQIADNFEQETRLLNRVLTQRAEQHDAIVAAVNAMQSMTPAPSPFELTRFAEAVRQRYPQVIGIGAWRQVKERSRPQALWRAGAAPVDWPEDTELFNVPAESEWFGVVPAPADRFTLVSRQRTLTGGNAVLALLIEPAALLRTEETPSSRIGFQLVASTTSTPLLSAQAESHSGMLMRWLEPLRSQRALGIASQAFVVDAWQPIYFDELDPRRMLFATVAIGLAVLFITWLLEQRYLARQTARLSAEQLARERLKATVTVEATADALVAFDASGHVTLANPAARNLVGLDHDPIGQPIEEVIPLMHSEVEGQPYSPLNALRAAAAAQELPDALMLASHGSSPRLIEGSLSPLFDELGRFAGGVLACRDLGPFRRRTLAALEQTERRLREHEAKLARVTQESSLAEMASAIAHELNQPLAAILSRTQAAVRLLDDEPAEVDSARNALDATVKHARRAGDIVSRLRALATRQAFSEHTIDLNQVVRHAEALTSEAADRLQVAVRTELAATLPSVRGDAIQLEQVVVNLIKNALEAMGRSATQEPLVRVATLRHARHVLLTVSDNGPGIPPENLPRLFDPFFTTRADGMGLGLAICQNIVTAHGGTLTAENRRDGGAVFTITLPAAEEPR